VLVAAIIEAERLRSTASSTDAQSTTSVGCGFAAGADVALTVGVGAPT
jgi:hypothetical protein